MSVQSQDTYTNATTPLSVVASGGSPSGPTLSTFSTFNISSLNAVSLTAGYITSGLVSSVIGDFEDIGCSSISTLGMILDGNILTSAGSELLLNGVPIATTSNISSLQDWSYDPAISTLNMNGNSTINGTLLSTLTINAGSAVINNLVCNDISTITLTVQSTIHAISTISSLEIEAQVAVFSSINGAVFPAPLVSSFGTASVSSLTASTINGAVFPAPLVSSFEIASVSSLTASTINGAVFPSPSVSSFEVASISSLTTSSINGVAYPPPGTDLSQWATLPAISSVHSGAGPTDDLNLVGTRYINAFAIGVSTVVDRGVDVGGNAFYRVTTQNGNRGEISLTANPGAGGIYGEINITANGGTTPALVSQGGLINITANTPIGTDPTLTSAIKLSGAGINSYAGAVPSIGSLLGYNFIYGTLGVNLCAGLPSVVPNTPGTTYLYGTTGITLGAQTDTASDFVQSNGGIYTTLLTGYWAGGILAPQNLLIRGRQIPVIGNSYVSLSNVDVLSFDTGASGAITGVVSINGAAYPPPSPAFPTAISCATLLANTWVSTSELYVSSVNGAVYPPPAGSIPENLVVSSLTTASYVSTLAVTTSSINGYNPENPIVSSINVNGTANATLFSGNGGEINKISTNTLIVRSGGGINGGILLENDASAPAITKPIYFQTNNSTISFRATVIDGLSVVETLLSPGPFINDNGAYGNLAANILYLSPLVTSHAVTLKSDAANSTIIASVGMSISSLTNVSSINGAAYPPPAGSIPSNLVVSTLVASEYVSTLRLNVSSLGVSSAYVAFDEADGSVLINGSGGDVFVSSTSLQVNGDLVANKNLYVSSIINVSSINGAVYPPPASGGIQSTIANAGSYVSIDGTGTISISTSLAAPINTRDFNVYVDNNVNLAVDNGAIRLENKSNSAYLDIGSVGVIIQGTSPSNNITLNNDGGISINGVGGSAGSYVNITQLSTINGTPFAPFSSIVGALGAANASVIIDAGGAISSVTAALQKYAVYSAGGIDLTTNGLGVVLKDIDSGGSITIRGDVTVTGNSMILGDVPLSVSSLTNVNTINGAAYPPVASIPANLIVSTLVAADSISTPTISTLNLWVSSVNGAVYPPPSSGGSPNGSFSTIVVSSFVNAVDVIGVSSIVIGNPATTEAGYIYPRGSGTGDMYIVPGSYVGASGHVNISDPISGGYGKLQVGEITQLNRIVGLSSVMIDTTTSTLNVSSINGGIPALQYVEVTFGQVTTDTLVTTEVYTSSMSVSSINNQPYPYPAGIYSVVDGADTQTIDIPGIVSTSIVSAIYVHANGGGGSQYLKNIIPGTGSVSTLWGTTSATGESIIWNVLKF